MARRRPSCQLTCERAPASTSAAVLTRVPTSAYLCRGRWEALPTFPGAQQRCARCAGLTIAIQHSFYR
ncbi:hypothetical protein B484DRAFT_448389 [Ochromonadaceae sp. CCMP2298]|nr:hypothetical protein B484DRAFT_448389 [Ochromonadaceae sp. CCMP2298]